MIEARSLQSPDDSREQLNAHIAPPFISDQNTSIRIGPVEVPEGHRVLLELVADEGTALRLFMDVRANASLAAHRGAVLFAQRAGGG